MMMILHLPELNGFERLLMILLQIHICRRDHEASCRAAGLEVCGAALSWRFLKVVELVNLNLPLLESLFILVRTVDEAVDFFLGGFLKYPLGVDIFASKLRRHKRVNHALLLEEFEVMARRLQFQGQLLRLLEENVLNFYRLSEYVVLQFQLLGEESIELLSILAQLFDLDFVIGHGTLELILRPRLINRSLIPLSAQLPLLVFEPLLHRPLVLRQNLLESVQIGRL